MPRMRVALRACAPWHGRRRDDPRLNDAIEFWEFAIHVHVAAVEQRLLPAGSNPAAGILTVLAVERVSHFHAGNHAPDWRKALGVVLRREIAERDVDLRGPSVRHGERERHGAATVRLFGRIVGNRPAPPCPRDLRIAIDPELRPAFGDDAEEARVVEVAA